MHAGHRVRRQHACLQERTFGYAQILCAVWKFALPASYVKAHTLHVPRVFFLTLGAILSQVRYVTQPFSVCIRNPVASPTADEVISSCLLFKLFAGQMATIDYLLWTWKFYLKLSSKWNIGVLTAVFVHHNLNKKNPAN